MEGSRRAGGGAPECVFPFILLELLCVVGTIRKEIYISNSVAVVLILSAFTG